MLFFDEIIFNYLNGLSPFLLKIAFLMSYSIYLLIASITIIEFRKSKKKGYFTFMILILSLIINTLLKYIFNVSRPYEKIENFNPAYAESSPSFPSGHTQLGFTAAALSSNYRTIFYIWAFLISISRIVLGVHYLSDVVVGAILGYLIGFITMKNEKRITDFLYNLESRRQLVHAFAGIMIFGIVYILPEYNSKIILSTLTVIVISISYLIKKGVKIPLVRFIIENFERRGEIPAKGAIFFLIGSLITLFIFHSFIASISILILGLHDSFATMIGKEFGKRKIPYNKNKTIEGSISGMVIGFIGASFFLPSEIAFITVLVAGIIESVDFRIDDNLLIPLASALMIYLLL
jgi:dolichol kinase